MSAANLAHRSMWSNKVHLANLMASPLCANTAFNFCSELFVGRTVSHKRAQIELVDGKQAVSELTLGGESHSVAVAAKRLCHAGDNTDFTDAIEIPEPLSGFMASLNGLQWENFTDGSHDLFLTHDPIVRPAFVGIEWHPFDESNHDAHVTTKTSEVHELVIIHASHDDTVDLYRVKTSFERCINAIEDRVEFISTSQLKEPFLL